MGIIIIWVKNKMKVRAFLLQLFFYWNFVFIWEGNPFKLSCLLSQFLGVFVLGSRFFGPFVWVRRCSFHSVAFCDLFIAHLLVFVPFCRLFPHSDFLSLPALFGSLDFICSAVSKLSVYFHFNLQPYICILQGGFSYFLNQIHSHSSVKFDSLFDDFSCAFENSPRNA